MLCPLDHARCYSATDSLLQLDFFTDGHTELDEWCLRSGAASVTGPASSHLPTSWSPSFPGIQPFRDVDEPIGSFCNDLACRNATLYAGNLDKFLSTPGECHRFSSQNNSMRYITQNDYDLSIALTYVSGCGSRMQYDNGVSMGNYSHCVSNFKSLLDSCKNDSIPLFYATDSL